MKGVEGFQNEAIQYFYWKAVNEGSVTRWDVRQKLRSLYPKTHTHYASQH